MKVFVPALILVAGICASPVFAQAQTNEPTKQEIEEAYRSRAGVISIGRARVKQIRGWQIQFKRLGAKKTAGVRKTTYDARAKKSGSCAHYLVTETVPPMGMPVPNRGPLPMVVVEPQGVMSCR